jgi:uncharacterized LabA/DUF88 family protein
MTRFGIFVDAGYLFAQGSALLVGERQSRRLIDIHIPTLQEELLALGAKMSREAPLRTYWYDGAPHGRLSAQQAELAETDGIKLRIGSINSVGEQKGVDSLMVTDLIELARNRAIADAVVVTGDEDIIIGVLVAQSFGVRVHLLGIEPARGTQSQRLRMEVDSLTEWTRADIATFMRILPQARLQSPPDRPGAVSFAGSDPAESIAIIASLVEEEVACLDADLIDMGRRHIAEGTPGLPPEIDGPILAACGRAVGRKLTDEERRGLRRLARALVQGIPATTE